MSIQSLAFIISLCRGPGRPCSLGCPISAFVLLALAQLALTPAHAGNFLEAPQEDHDVIVLTEGNFEAAIEKNPIMLVKFYAPWCDHCRHFAPTYSSIAKRLKHTKPPIACGQVDVTKQEQLRKTHDIKGYPTVLAFIHGQKKVFDEHRDEETIVKFAHRWAPPLAEYLPDVAAAQVFEKDRHLIFVAAFEDPRKKAGDKEWSDSFGGNFKQLCHSKYEHEVSFAYTSDAEVALRYSLGHPPSLGAVFPGSTAADHLMAYKGPVTSYADMEDWVKYSQMPAVSEFDGEISPGLLANPRAMLFVFRDRDGQGLAAEQVARSASGAISRRVIVVLMEPQGPAGRDLLQKAGVAMEADVVEPTFWLYKHGSESYRLHGDTQSVESISAFVDDFMAGMLTPLNEAMAHEET